MGWENCSCGCVLWVGGVRREMYFWRLLLLRVRSAVVDWGSEGSYLGVGEMGWGGWVSRNGEVRKELTSLLLRWFLVLRYLFI